jgi:hypothetical protein
MAYVQGLYVSPGGWHTNINLHQLWSYDQVERTAQKEMTYMTHMLKISLLLENLAKEKAKVEDETSTLSVFVNGVCDTVNLLLIRFVTEINDSDPIDELTVVSEWDIITKEG